ncbi:hypothetical protein BT96DRAFT_650852, partial [Gymnopus androsaceus JB14]
LPYAGAPAESHRGKRIFCLTCLVRGKIYRDTVPSPPSTGNGGEFGQIANLVESSQAPATPSHSSAVGGKYGPSFVP